MDNSKYFEYMEYVSKNKTLPLIKFNKGNEYYSISNYFDNLNLEDISELNIIFNYSKKALYYLDNEDIEKYKITRETWLKYKIANNITINPLNETIKYTNDINDEITILYGTNHNYKDLSFPKVSINELVENEYNIKLKKNKPLFNSNSNNTQNNNDLILIKSGFYNNSRELLYMVLNCLFNSNCTLYIKKCKLCNKYYLTDKINKTYCDRKRYVCGKLSDCVHSLDDLYKSSQYKNIVRKKENFISKYYKKNDEISLNKKNKFNNEYDLLFQKYKDKRDITIDDINEIDNFISNYH